VHRAEAATTSLLEGAPISNSQPLLLGGGAAATLAAGMLAVKRHRKTLPIA
jgi:hypothetical protein